MSDSLTLELYGKIGIAYQSLGKYEESIDYFQQQLAIARETKNRQSEGEVLGNLGITYQLLGQYERSIDYFQQQLVIAREIKDRQSESKALGNLGITYQSLGQYESSIDYFQRQLAIAREIKDRQSESKALGNLGITYQSLGQYESSIDFFQQQLVIAREIKDRLSEGRALGNLGICYENQGRYSEVEPLYKQALEMSKQLLGYAHPDIASSLNNLAGIYYLQGRYSEAEPLFLEALEMRKQLLGSAHPDIASSLNNLAALYKFLGQYNEAESLFLEALEMRKQLLGSAHPDIASSLNNLAAIYKFLGRYSEAEPLFLEALEMRKQLLGSAHPDIASSLNSLAELYKSLGRYAEAEPLFLEATTMFVSQLGEDHPNTQTVRQNYRRFLQQVLNENRQGELSNERSWQIISEIAPSQNTIIEDDPIPPEARKLAVSNMQMLAKKPSLRDEEASIILDAAIDNLNESDGYNLQLNTPMDEAFDAVMQSRFAKLCHDRLLQGYIQSRDLRRNIIGSVFLSRAITDNRILNADNATQILEPLLQNLFMDRSIEELVDTALQLVETFYRPQSKSSTRIDFLPHKLLRTTVNVLLTTVEDETASNDAIVTAAIWALLWLTNAKASNPYTVYKFTEGELDSLRRIARNEKRDAFARSYTVLILSICSSEKTVFAQADWIYEWAVVADGAKPQRQLPVMTPLNRPKDVSIFKDSICSDLPIKAKRSVAIALGRLGCFMSEMVEPLLQIFQSERYSWNQRDEALVYLVLTGGHQVISVLIQGASSPFKNDSKKYDFLMRCFLGLVGMGDVDALEYLLDLGGEQSVVDSYAYALAGVADSRGREILEFMKNHKKNQVRSAVAKALSKLNQWNFSGGQSNKSSLSNNNSTTITDRMISKQGHLVHKLKAKDSTGRWAYYFVYVNPNSEQAFLEALNSNKNIDLEEYGTVIGSCYGEKPNQELRYLLKEKYGFDV